MQDEKVAFQNKDHKNQDCLSGLANKPLRRIKTYKKLIKEAEKIAVQLVKRGS